MDLASFLGVAGSAATGGLLGVVGGLLRQGLDFVKRRSELAQELAILKEKNAHEQTLRDKDREILKLEGENAVKVAQAKADGDVDTARMNAIAASFAADKATFATGEKAKDSAWFIAVDVVRGVIRPGITLLFDLALLVIWGLLVWLLWEYMGALFAAQDKVAIKTATDLLIEITRAIVQLAVMCTSYWFIARPHSERSA